jgi:type III pantothenate kinase
MRIGVIDVGNTRVHRGLFDGRRIRPLDRRKVDLWIGCRVGRPLPPRGTLLLGRDFPPLVKNRTRNPSGVGADRLAQASAAWRRVRKACVVVSMGTAITVDRVNTRGELVGGLIAPGLLTMAKALHGGTARLPRVPVARRRSPLGRDTREAIQAGISLSVEGLLRRALEKVGGPVFGTGGDAPLFREFFDTLVPDLALEGVAFSYLCSLRS